VFFLVVIMVLLCEIRVHGQTPQSNQGSQGQQRAKPGFRQQIRVRVRLIWDKKIRFFFRPSYCYVWGKYPV
jgi:hypothetical protein